MEFENVLRGRRSIRAYTPEPLGDDVVAEILSAARWSPSWRNTQAWTIWVVTGAALERFKERFRAAVATDVPPAPDFAATAADDWPAACSLRTRQMMQARSATLAAAGEAADPAAAMARMAGLFGAPCLLVFGIEDCLSEAYAAFDTGSLVQSVCLAAYDRGLGTCIVATIVRYPGLLRELLPNGDGKRIVVGVTLGHPDQAHAANSFERSRAPLDELVTWVR
jgi:nitroreductase